jgi:signal transduction histidine kinase
MFKNCERMKMAIQNVREFIHEEKITKEKIQLRSILDGVLIFWRQRLENHGISFRTYGIDGVEIWANRMEVEQILLGLVQHAFTSIEYLADKWIEINTLSKGEFVFIYFKFSEEMSVENVGLKLASSLADLQDEESEVILSLALAKSLAKNNGGDLECLKDVRHTTLVLTVPMAPQEFQGADLFH